MKIKRIFSLFALIIFSSTTFALTLSSPSIKNGGALPSQFTCDGKNIPPAFVFRDIPADTQSLVFIIADPDAPKGLFYHWIVYDLLPQTQGLPEGGALPVNAKMGKNSYGYQAYNGPCPPAGKLHHYHFILYALNTPLSVAFGSTGPEVFTALQPHMLAKAELIAVYSRG